MHIPPLYNWPKKSLWSERERTDQKWGLFSGYIHYPFCRHLCDFCGYETRLVNKRLVNRVANKMRLELNNSELDDFQSATLGSIFFGGGTASLMPLDLLRECIVRLVAMAGGHPCPEITLECEPGTISVQKLAGAVGAGVNRISVCAQSLDDTLLAALGRKHKTCDSLQLIDRATALGIENVHIDLMYSLPEQTLSDWERTLVAAAQLPVTHISTYKLYVFKHGSLHRAGFSRGTEESPESTERASTMHRAAQEVLGNFGFEQYSLTEFARPGRRSDYITSCFDGRDILPLGPGACGRNHDELWENSPYISRYLDHDSRFPTRGVRLGRADSFKRDTILGLWLLKVDLTALASRHGVLPTRALENLLLRLHEDGLADLSGNILTLQPHHRFHAGMIMARLDELPAELWAYPVDGQHETRVEVLSAQGKFPQLRQLARVARRDTALYHSLSSDPKSTLQSLGYSLDDADVQALVNVIELTQNATSDLKDASRFWEAVAAEHNDSVAQFKAATDESVRALEN